MEVSSMEMSNSVRAEIKLQTEMFNELMNKDSQFRKFFDQRYGENTHTRFTISELVNEFRKYKRSVVSQASA
jgi:hypothetical protein